MRDLLESPYAEEALKLGWRVLEVYDLKTKRVVPCLIVPNAERWDRDALTARINALARARAEVAVKTLQALTSRGTR